MKNQQGPNRQKERVKRKQLIKQKTKKQWGDFIRPNQKDLK